MSLEQQLTEARQALDELTTDEQELTRLEAEKAAEIDRLKAEGSKDFATLSTLEGQRQALRSMLADQRAAIEQKAGQVEELDAARAREVALLEMKATATQTRQAATAERAAHIALVNALEQHLSPLLELQVKRRALRLTFRQQAEALGVDLYDGGGQIGLGLTGEAMEQREAEVQALFADLEAHGADVEALRLKVAGFGLSHFFDLFQEPLPWRWAEATAQNPLPVWASFWQRLGGYSDQLIDDARHMYAAANDPAAIKERMIHEGKVKP